MKKRFFSFLLAGMVALQTPMFVLAETSTDVKKQQEETQERLDEVTSQVETIAEQKQILADEIVVLDSQLVDILTSISVCEDEIIAKEKEIDETKEKLQEANDLRTEQYEQMIKRVQFMYEKGDAAYMEVLTKASSYADMINKVAYVEDLYEYDRQLLVQYEVTINTISQMEQTLEEEEADLLASQDELNEEKLYLENLIDVKRATVENFETQLANAKAQVNNYKAQLQEQTEKLRQLEEAERAERERIESENGAKNGTTLGLIVKAPNGGSAPAPYEKVQIEGSGIGAEAANYGCEFLGNPYVFGGTSLTNGTDCSGFTQSVYKHFGINIPRDSTSQRYAGVGVDYSEAQPGDLICYAGHVALYIGNGKIVHASTERTGIKISNATYRTILAVRRVA